ncbi:MAG TPA: fibrobacter succinogenes major paralogous domain-containing protein [Bacteroidales bacterium]|nr:fibrobacter succinogenes major paralogous domain-containing protein [Bacteroidales bacterium]
MANKKAALILLILFVTIVINAQAVRDADGNVYSTVTMGKQVWMGENLMTTKFNDGSDIPFITGDKEWKALKSPGYCWLNNDRSYKEVYGGLYNWYAVKTKKLCPKGWHVPSDAEWNVLAAFLGGEENAGNLLKEEGDEHWKNSLTICYNQYGFTALPGGMRLSSGTFPTFANSYCVWWTSDGDTKLKLAWNRGLFFSSNRMYKGNEGMSSGFSVRCLMDR